MLKVQEIHITDKQENRLTISGNHVERFPLVGGEEANPITIKSWNQQGNTFINAFMDSFEGELLFIIPANNKTPEELLKAREEVTSICNPLNGTVTIKVILNSGQIFKRDVSFISAPIFPIGFENRNENWQKVQLLYEANNPFWYSEAEILESFQGVDPLFHFPITTDTFIFGEVIPANVAINKGQAEAPVTIKIAGACVNPMIENITTGEFIRFKDLTMVETDELIIDTTFGQKKVELNGVNVFNKLDFSSTFFNLIKGENEIEFKDDTGSTEASIHFIYKNLYITI